jgi:hypothetical protein
MKMPSFPHKVTKQGVSVNIGRVEKDGQNFFRVLYREQGKRKQAWRSSFEDAKRAADDAIEAMLTGDASALKLSAAERHSYLRAVEFVAPLNIPLDHAAREYAEIRIMLAGKATPAEERTERFDGAFPVLANTRQLAHRPVFQKFLFLPNRHLHEPRFGRVGGQLGQTRGAGQTARNGQAETILQ